MTTLYLVNNVVQSRSYRIIEPQYLEQILVSSSIKIHLAARALAHFSAERWFWIWKVIKTKRPLPPTSVNHRGKISHQKVRTESVNCFYNYWIA